MRKEKLSILHTSSGPIVIVLSNLLLAFALYFIARVEFLLENLSLFADSDLVGECGIDKLCRVPARRQSQLFEWQATIAADMQKPMVIHCVRATDEVIRMRSMLTAQHKSLPTWVIHGFTGNTQLASQLFRAGIWVSFGNAITDCRRTKVRDSLSRLTSPFLLETDDSGADIRDVYAAAAELRQCDIETLAATVRENYMKLFAKPTAQPSYTR